MSDRTASAGRRGTESGTPFVFSAFLSHRYKSPVVNKFFFRVFNTVANVQFSVDKGVFRTNVTRLERMMRGSDCFVGIYPAPREQHEPFSATELEDASKYFRLELGLAARWNRPAIALIDERYKDVISVPPSVMEYRYNWQEVFGQGIAPGEQQLTEFFHNFCKQVQLTTAMTRQQRARTRVGILVPRIPGRSGRGYSTSNVGVIEKAVAETGATPQVLPWPPKLDAPFYTALEQFDWMILDVGETTAKTGIV